MRIYFLRHATAEALARTDAQRELTSEGREEARIAGAALKKMKIEPGGIFTSPLVRARQTAEAAALALGWEGKVKTAAALTNEATDAEFFGFLSQPGAARSLLVVGHSPSMPARIAALIGADSGDRLALGKGSMACVEVRREEPGGGELRWFMRQKQLEWLVG